MARDKGPIVFLLGPSGVGKSTLGQWLAEDSALLSLEIDRFPRGDGIDAEGLRKEWDSFFSGGSPAPLVAAIRSRVAEAKAAGAVLSFPSRLVLNASRLHELRDLGVTSLVLYGTAAACLNAFLEQEKMLKRVAGDLVEFWFSQNRHSYFEFSRPEFAPFRVVAFQKDKRVSRADLVAEVQQRAAA